MVDCWAERLTQRHDMYPETIALWDFEADLRLFRGAVHSPPRPAEGPRQIGDERNGASNFYFEVARTSYDLPPEVPADWTVGAAHEPGWDYYVESLKRLMESVLKEDLDSDSESHTTEPFRICPCFV